MWQNNIPQKYSGPSPRECIAIGGLERGLEKWFSINIPGDFITWQVWKHYYGLFFCFPIKGYLSNLNLLYYNTTRHSLPSEADTEQCNCWVMQCVHFNIIWDTAKLPHNVAVAMYSPLTISVCLLVSKKNELHPICLHVLISNFTRTHHHNPSLSICFILF